MLLLRMAFRNLFRQYRRTILTGLSIGGGYIVFVLSVSLVEGSYGNVIDIFTKDSVGHIQIHQKSYREKPKTYLTIKNRQEVEELFLKESKIISFTPRVLSMALAYGKDKSTPVKVLGIDPNLESDVTRIKEKIFSGNYFDSIPNADGYYKAMIGSSIAKSLKINIGDELILIGQGAEGSIANDIFIVSSIVGNEDSFDRMTVYLPLIAAQSFLSLSDEVHQYALLVNTPKRNVEIADELQETLSNLEVAPWQRIETTFYQTMQADKKGNNYTLVLIVFLVFVGVLNTILMSVLERTKEFGVIRAIGCRPSKLILLINLETMFLTLLSISLSLIIVIPMIYWFANTGFLLSEPIDMGGVMFQHMRGEFSLYVFLKPMIIIFITSMLVSLPPGFRAARMTPKNAMDIN